MTTQREQPEHRHERPNRAPSAQMVRDRIEGLIRDGVPFVRVTVVRAQKPTSVRAGNEAIVLGDGSIEGFIGGVCAEDSVRRAALDALADGETLLLRVLPNQEQEFPAAPGARVVHNPCLSGGAMEMFLEPLLPAPRVVLAGDSPISAALRAMAPSIGFDVDEADVSPVGAMAVIVSTLGRDDHAQIRAALDAGVPLIGLVASPRRGVAVLDELGLDEAERARVRTPVGLWIGAKTAEEIALSILAELIKAVRLEGLTPSSHPMAIPEHPTAAAGPTAARAATSGPVISAPATVATATTVLDPSCGMTVTVTAHTPHLDAGMSPDGQEHWFCGPGCRDAFAPGRA